MIACVAIKLHLCACVVIVERLNEYSVQCDFIMYNTLCRERFLLEVSQESHEQLACWAVCCVVADLSRIRV